MFYIATMEAKTIAVLTGDLVDSSKISGDYISPLNNIASDIQLHQDQSFRLELFRGDGFQALIMNPENALRISTLIRAGLRRYTRGNSVDNSWDARIAIGIGAVKDPGKLSASELKTTEGVAFTLSGRSLDSMKNEAQRLKICSGNQQLDDEFSAVCPLIDSITGRWTTSQAEAVYLQLLEGLTQEEIGKRLGISQRASGKRLESSNISQIKLYMNRYSTLIKWNFST